MRRMVLLALTLAALGAAAVASMRAQQPAGGAAAAPPVLETLRVQRNIYAIFGAGGNVTVQIGDEGILLVDTGLAASASAVFAEVRKLSNRPIRFIINTHFHPDHVGGNAPLSTAPADPRPDFATTAGPGANDPLQPLNIIAHERVLNRMTAALPKLQPGQMGGSERLRGMPIDEYFMPTKDMHFNGEAIILYHEPNAHTDGDSIVFFRKSDVVASGDVFVTTSYPYIDQANGGSIQGEINALNRILDITVPAHEQEGGTFVIPGHGRVCDEADVLEYRDMVTIIRDRIADMVKRKLTLDQVKAAKPTLDYDLHYGSTTGFVTTAGFIEAVYKDLSNPQGKPRVR